MKHTMLALIVVVIFHGTWPTDVCAQVSNTITQGATLPVSVLGPSGAVSIETNPAALSDVEGWAVTYAHQEGPRGSLENSERDSVWSALSIGRFGGLGAGFDVERPRDPSVPDHGTLLFSGALSGDPRFSLGGTWRIRIPRGQGSPAHTADLAMMMRPATSLALLLAGQNLAIGGNELNGQPITRRGVAGVGVRPFGDDRWGLELVGSVSENREFGFRGQTSFYVPKVGELLVAGEMQDLDAGQEWLLSAGARLIFGGAAVGGAALSDGGFDELGWSVWADMQSKPRPGVPRPGYIAEIATQGGARSLPATLRQLERARFDPEVRGVVLQPEGSGIGLAGAQEIRLAIQTLQQAGKPVYCFLQAASGPEYYACASTTRIGLDPAGNVRLSGLSSDALLLGGLIERMGLRADFVRIGRYKSAPETWTNRVSSEGAREQRIALLDDAYRRLTEDLAGDLDVSAAEVRSRVDQGPFTSKEAIDAGLVQATLDPTEISEDARDVFDGCARMRKLGDTRQHAQWGATPQIGVVMVDGTIVDGENVDLPILDIHMSGGKTVAKTLDAMAADSRIEAIVLRVDSPGGAVMASDQIWRAVRRATKKKPVIASMGSVAASGGYYVASAADEIWAAPSTITGSIGIFYGKVDAAELAARFDVGIEQERRGAHAGAESLFRPFTSEERAALTDKLRFWYRQFLERVAEGRRMPVKDVDALARGRVYTGDAAHAVKLVDALGSFNSALARARELAGIGPRAPIVVRPERPSTLLDYVLGAGDGGRVLQRAGARVATPWLESLWLMDQLAGASPVALWEGPTKFE